MQQTGKNLRLTVDYRFTAGKPDPQKKYRLLVSIDSNKTTKLRAHLEFKGNKFAIKDTMVKEFPFKAATVGTKFELWLEEVDGGPEGTTISNKITGTVEAALADAAPAAKVQFQIVSASVSTVGAAKRGCCGWESRSSAVDPAGGPAQSQGDLHLNHGCPGHHGGATGPASPFQAGNCDQNLP